jgi:hypothetical protein
VALVDSAFVRAMREGWVVMIDEVNTARDVALLSINATLDGRLTLYLAATGETVVARPGFAVLLAYNPGLVGATDIPDAWHSRFPATLEVTSNWPALAELGAPAALVAEAMRLDHQRLYPVWALIGPGLSDPGHIEIHSRTVYLDSDALLGPREAIAAGRLEQRAILRCFGVALHETFHAKHTKRWASSTTSSCPSPTTRPAAGSRSTGGCSKSRGWRPTACASSRPTRCEAGSSARRCKRPSRT